MREISHEICWTKKEAAALLGITYQRLMHASWRDYVPRKGSVVWGRRTFYSIADLRSTAEHFNVDFDQVVENAKKEEGGDRSGVTVSR